jgi:hypothetical protein
MKSQLHYYAAQARSLAERAQCAAAQQDEPERHTLSDRCARIRVRAEESLDLVDLFQFNERTRWGRR